jgi:long-chain acyl-CoA synthetase
MNLASSIEGHADGRVALVDGNGSVTYGELRERVADARAALAAAGCGLDDRVAIVAPNQSETVVALLAVLGVGAVAVPLNPQATEPELARELADADVTAVVGLPVDAPSDLTRVDLIPRPDAAPVGIAEREPDDLAVLMFTSGTAGESQAAALTHGNLRANQEQADRIPEMVRRADDITLGLLPLFHVFGLNVVLLPALRAGGRIVLVDGFDPAEVLALVARHEVTLLTGTPTVWAAFEALDHDAVADDALSSIRLAASGAAQLSVAVARRIEERFGVHVHEGYGLTETSPIVATSVGTSAPAGSIGRPLPGVEVRLLDTDNADVFVGDVGHLHVRGPNVFSGYWDAPEATAAVLSDDGWLRTGDLAVVDDDGHLFIVDRAKDLVIVSGFNVAPAEVERVLLAHPSVADAAVHGRPDDRTGEALVADVVARGEEPTDPDAWFAELADHLAQHLSRYKCPADYRLVPAIPRGLGGKVQRRLLGDVEGGPPTST